MDILPTSDLWWRYLIYGALFHIVAVTPACRSEKYANAFRLAGYGIAAVPVLLRLGLLPALLMLACLYGFTFALKYFTSFFGRS